MIPLQIDIAGYLSSRLKEALPVLRDIFASEFGLAIVFGIFILEGAMLLYFIPSEGIIPAAVFLTDGGPLDVALLLAVAVIGATAGQFALFSASKRLGRERLLESRWVRVSDERLGRFDQWFESWGPIVVPVSNSLLFTRGMLTIPAGLAELEDREFLLLSAVGTLSFESLLAGATLFLLSV
ncbi:MAG: VTT domain-containing protein [Halobacteriales archaeon]|nr:VTT domain-containing protein [Halobacteriales archaeon]